MPLSDKDQKDIIAGALDPKKVYFYCKSHNYFGPSNLNPDAYPGVGCPNCWKVYFLHILAQVPPSKREEKLEELEEVMYNVVQLANEGKWDFLPYDHAKVEIGKE